MDQDRLRDVLERLSKNELSPDEALDALKHLPYADLQFAKVDLHRALRQGAAEVIFCPGKTAAQITEIATKLRQHHKLVLASRADAETARKVLPNFSDATYLESGRMLVFGSMPEPDDSFPSVSILTAGTSDLPVADEAALVLQASGVPVVRINDVGVAGLHRLLDNIDSVKSTAVSIVVAGMDGALPSVTAGMIAHPVIAVPTSVGYGASFQGIAALLAMLNSCAAGLTVVNIDNGFGAAMAALRIVTQAKVGSRVR